ncbi:MAG: transglutaminase-like domain-containing protein [Pseudomonadales bacterium]
MRRLSLELNPAAAKAFDNAPGQQLSTIDDTIRLTLDRSDAAFEMPATRPQDSRVETMSYPRTPATAELASRAVGDADNDGERARRLTQFVHEFLSYRDATSALTFDDIVEKREGDCTEYAELFTTLARAIGLPARTVSGLVYRDEEGDPLVLHAWNEVVIDGKWFSVDPTWNEFGIDATHLRFPLGPDRLMRAHTLLSQMRFKVIEVDSR